MAGPTRRHGAGNKRIEQKEQANGLKHEAHYSRDDVFEHE
jgi:hypothetical protein